MPLITAVNVIVSSSLLSGRSDRRDMRRQQDVTFTISDAIDPTLSKLERTRIVNNTRITYSETELLQLVHEHLS